MLGSISVTGGTSHEVIAPFSPAGDITKPGTLKWRQLNVTRVHPQYINMRVEVHGQ